MHQQLFLTHFILNGLFNLLLFHITEPCGCLGLVEIFLVLFIEMFYFLPLPVGTDMD